MTDVAPGTRVWAVANWTEEVVYAFGYGTYVGDVPGAWPALTDADRAEAERAIRGADAHPIDLEVVADTMVTAGMITREEADRRLAATAARDASEQARPMADRVEALLYERSLNPKIVLDEGGVVWGRECYWAPIDEDEQLRFIAGREVEFVPAPDRKTVAS